MAITVSSGLAHGPDGDRGGDALVALLERHDCHLVEREVIKDDRRLIADRLRYWCDQVGCDLILTCGGTGFSPDDLTPEATEDVLERRAPGFSEAMRMASKPHSRNWMLSRATAGTRGSTLILNLPGNPKSIAEIGDELMAPLRHAVHLLRGGRGGHGH